jgi:hypothetical protein
MCLLAGVWLDARKAVKIDLGKIKVQTVLVLDLIGGVRLQSLGYAPNEQTKSVVPHLRRSTAWLWTQPFRAGLIFGAGPLGLDCRFPMFIPPLTCRRQVGLGMTKGRAALSFVSRAEPRDLQFLSL